jgi:hypothetical protein
MTQSIWNFSPWVWNHTPSGRLGERKENVVNSVLGLKPQFEERDVRAALNKIIEFKTK